MVLTQEPDFPPGHPARFDYDPNSRDAIEWVRVNVHPKGERDFPVDHPKAIDTAGNTNSVEILPGVDPLHPELEAFTGRTPFIAAQVKRLNAQLAAKAQESPALEPVIAPPPPKPGSIQPPAGQP